MKVCHNCRGSGKVDGGFKKRTDKDVLVLQRAFDQDVVQVKVSKIDQDAKDKKIKDLEKSLKKAVDKINCDHRIADCLYCGGSGRRA